LLSRGVAVRARARFAPGELGACACSCARTFVHLRAGARTRDGAGKRARVKQARTRVGVAAALLAANFSCCRDVQESELTEASMRALASVRAQRGSGSARSIVMVCVAEGALPVYRFSIHKKRRMHEKLL
jgi:hypothetical protein